MKTKISISDFAFLPSGHGHYRVTYTSPVTGNRWIKTINDMTLIDATKNAQSPKVKDLEALKSLVKSN